MSSASPLLHDSIAQIKTWNQVSMEPVWRCIHGLITEQATKNPDGLAIDAWDGQLTYHELEELSGALASHLRHRGVRKEIKVPICFEKSKWAVVSILAILKAGGAFVPLDPAYPVDRLRGIVAATGAPILLASTDNIRLFAQGVADVVEVSGQTSEEWAKGASGGVAVGEEVDPSNAAYVLYTSGSTGTPKGCEIPMMSLAFAHSSLAAKPPRSISSTYGVRSSTLGRGIGTKCWVVDFEGKRHCRIDEVGELLIESPAMARGYLDDAEKTRKSFIDPPEWLKFMGVESKLYRTGDLVAYAHDGTLVYAGRVDHQVKVRGQRMELGEVEHAINMIGTVDSVIVMLFNRTLLAVVSFRDQAEKQDGVLQLQMDSIREWRERIRGIQQELSLKLPQYMIPTTWLVSKLPTSLLSGKLDRKRVADWVSSLTPDDIRRGQLQEDVNEEGSGETKTEQEMILQQCCSETLNLHSDEIGLNRSFLELGGDSITAMQLVAKCRSRGIGVTVKDILKSRSLRQLARNADTHPNGTSTHLDEEDESVYYQPFDLSPIQRFFFEKSPDGEDHFNQSFLLELKVEPTVDALRNAIEAVMERHVMLRARFRRNAAGEWFQLVCPPHEPNSYLLEYAEGLPEDKLLSTIAGFQARLDLRRGPLVVFGLWALDSGTRVLFASCHHAVIDLVSWRVILQELEEHLQHGRISSPKTISFPRWLSLQREYFKCFDSAKALPHDIREPQLEFWGVSRLQNKVEDIVTSNFILDAEATTALLSADGRSRLNAEPVDLLVGCLISSFHNIFPERQTPVVFNEGHGREPWSPSIDVSRTVGWFTTMLPVQSQCENVIDTIIDVKDARRIAPLNGLAYFSSRYLNPEGVERHGSHQDSEIIFNYEGIFQQFERSGGLFRQSPLSNPHQLSDNGSRSNRITLFEWTATVKRGRLHVTVDFHRHMQHQDRILRWVEEYDALLRRLPEELMRQKPIVTRSDTLLQLPKADWIKLRRLLGPAAAENLEDLYDCTSMQEGMLISQSRDAQLYMVDVTATIKPLPGVDGVDLQRLREAWETVEVRHPALRTYFAAGLPGCGAFSQVVLRERVSKVLGEGASPCQFVVREQGDGIILMHLRISHVAADADSLGLILRDISLAYDGRLPSEDAPRYSQYIAWCEDQDDDGAREYWAKYTQGMVPCRVPVTESALEPPTYSRCNVEVPDISGMQHFCTAQNVTVSHVIHAAWALVLQAYLAQDEVCFGYFASDRDMGQHGASDSVGVFVNALVCHVRLHENMTVGELVKTMREDCIDGLTNQRGCSLAKIQHDLGGQQLFNTGVSVQRDWVGIWESELCSASNVNWEETNDFGLAINVIEGDAGPEISLGYAQGTIAESQVQSIASAFGQAISDITLGNAARKIPEVLLISKADQSKIGSWNGPKLPAINECIHHLFRAQVEKNPNAIAIDSWDGMMTYAELDKASDVVAHDLISRLGLQVGERVPFCFEKSRWVLVSILGILKAGAAFVPLEQSHPTDRLQWMATAVKARVAIVSPQYKQKVESVQNVLPLDQANFGKLNQDIDSTGFPAVTPDDTAAILFTSGSSGKPKGCVWQHKAWCSSATRQADGLYMRDSKRMLQFASYSFGASLIEMLTPLQLGATICIISDYDKMNNVEKAIAATGADAAVLPPSLLRSLNSLGSIKTLICGGESLDSHSIDRFSARIHLVAGYGSTEGAVVTCSKLMSKGLSAKCIGRPFNGSCWIVSPSNYHQLLPIGAVGELLIEGPHLAQGYLDQPEKTADAFIDDATWMPSVKYYRTGDLARFDPDTGDIYYAGRKDNMVKINGMRVELGEVEAHLKIFLPDFQGVAAELVKPESLPAMLMGFIAMGDDFDGEDPGYADTDQLQPVTAVTFERLASRIEGLDEKLAEKLPRHMIPAAYFPMRDLPLTASRKIDRVKLKSLGRRLRAAKIRLPTARRNRSHKGTLSTEMERHLKALWDELLPGHSIGPDDNFFSLGGDSLLAMRLVKKTSSLGSITVADVFKYPTLSAMAAAITKRSASIQDHAVEIAPFSLLGEDDKTADALRNVAAQCGVDVTTIQDLYPCTSLQMGMLALSAKHLGSHVAHLVIDVPNCFDEARFRTAARILVQQNPILRTRFVNGRQVLQAVVAEEPIFEHVEDVAEYLKAAKSRPVEFGQPLSRFVFSNDRDKATRVLVWSIHHALYDGWSIPLMMRDLGTFYDGKTHSDATAMIPHQHYGLQSISKLNEVAKQACEFTSFLVVHPAEEEAIDSCFKLRKDVTTDLAVFTTYAFILQCTLVPGGFNYTCNYDPRIILPETAGRVLAHFEHMIRILTQSGDREVLSIPTISPVDEQLIRQWEGPKIEGPSSCIHQLISEQVEQKPENLAVDSWDGSLTYWELWELSSKLAHRLVRLGVVPESRVLVCVDKSKWQIVAVLAILLAGGAFVPIDPSHPRENIQRIIDSAEADAAVIMASHGDLFPRIRHVVKIPSSWAESEDSIPVQSSVLPHNSAYVLYTSGSTGTPKGCVVEHAAFCHSALLQLHGVGLDRSSRVLNFASLSFDAAMGEILTTLIPGKTVCVLSEYERLNDLVAATTRLKADWAFFTPSLLSSIQPEDVRTLKVICCGGEAMDEKLVDIWRGRVTFINGYGPTECSVFCCSNLDPTAESPKNIGRCFSGRAWVTRADDTNSLVPVGAVGELIIESPAIARGYLNDETSTAEAFVSSPKWSSVDEADVPRRVYRTGDLVFQEPDGSLVYVGRLGSQIKLRGQRCETAEVERQISQIQDVAQVAVMLYGSGAHAKLVAVISLTSLPDYAGSEIQLLDGQRVSKAMEIAAKARSHLGQRLPAFMVPTCVLAVNRIPLTVGGKLDRRKITEWVGALSPYELRSYNSLRYDETLRKPANGLEISIRDIWSSVLNIQKDTISTTVSFMQLGGDSISAMQVVARFRSAGIGSATVQEILQANSISELASAIQARGDHKSTDANEDERLNSLFDLSPVQQWFFSKSPTGTSHFNQSTVLRINRPVPARDMASAVAAVVKRHSMLRARFEQDDSGNWKQKTVSVEQAGKSFGASHLQDVEELVSVVSVAETELDISNGPVFAVRLFDIKQQQYLFVTAHHLVVDLVSWRIILRDLEDYLDRGMLSEVPPLSFRAWLEGRKGLLGGIQARESTEPDLSLDCDAFWGVEENENVFSNCETRQFQLSEDMTATLLKSSDNPYRAEPQELMMTAIVYSFLQVFEERGLPQLYSEGHGRRSQAGRADSFETVGWFTSLHPVIPRKEPADVWEALRLVKDEHRLNAARETDYLHDTFSAKEDLVAGGQIKDLEVIFNYMGRFQQMEGSSLFSNISTSDPNTARELETKARSINPRMRRFALFDISALVENQRLSFTFVFPRHALHKDRILTWIQTCQTTLSSILLALPHQAPTLTLSDLPLLGVDNEQLKRMLSKKLPGAGVTDIRAVEDAYPCSPLQKGMLIAQLKDPRSYLVNLSFEVTSSSEGKPTDLGRLSSAWRQVVNRHSIFRTLIIDDMLRDGEPCQVVLRAADADVQVVECDMEETIYENLRSIDLILQASGASLPHRLVLYKGPNSRVFFKLEISHVLFDAFSVPIILREISLAYENRLPGVQGPRYSDFISHVQSQDTSKALVFWKDHLEGVVPCHIPHDDSKGGILESGAKSLEIERIDITGILAYCQKERVTLANVLQTAWALVLRVYTKQDDVCFSYMCSGRDVPVDGIETAIGPFISLLVCRARLESARRVAEAATKIQDDYLASLQYQHAVSLAEIQQTLGLRGRPLFNTGLSFARLPDGNHETSGLIFREIASRQSTDYDIAVNANVSGSNLRVRFTYNPTHISERQTGEVAECLVKIIDGIAASGGNSSVGDVLATVPSPTTQSALLSMTSQRSDDTVSIPSKGSHLPSFHQARTTTEAILQKLWAEAFHLNQEEIGMDDHFHQIGGDSLMAMRICSAARKAGMNMSVADIFKNPVLMDLAACVDSKSLRTEADWKVAPEDAMGPTLSAIGDPSLFEHAASQAGVSVANIEAIVEATDTQASMVAAGMKRPRTQTAYFTFDFIDEVDSHRLRAACEKLVQHHSILRTAFFGRRRRVYHVILKEIPQLDWTSHGGCDDLDKTSNAWIQASQHRNVEAGQQLTRFCFLQHNSGHSRLLLELSHAQYDGISFPLLLDGLQCASQSSEFACALKAAWAGVLARMNGSSDVVFGQLVSGRNVSFPGAEQVLGACVQTVPVRANIADGMTWGDLMRQLRQQQIDSIPHETLDLGIASIVRGDHVDISLAFADNVIPASYAQDLADMLCSNIHDCLNCPGASVMLTEDFVHESLPLLNVHPIVRRAWDAVLGAGQEFGVRDGNRPYWDFWDNEFAAAQLATHFKSSGIDIQTEEVVEMPTMALQSELVVERLRRN
ncbi:hypothetical protein DL768_001589 [Monosporascus sp. mg162]|nr:hypothetical protein DL768_001589 [Monosporascus sp. mg162]